MKGGGQRRCSLLWFNKAALHMKGVVRLSGRGAEASNARPPHYIRSIPSNFVRPWGGTTTVPSRTVCNK